MFEPDLAALRTLQEGGFQAIDWGSSSGGSIDHIRQRYKYDRVVGIDLDPVKVTNAREAGRVIIQADATNFDAGPGVVDASFMFHFLEHLPSLGHAEQVITQACLASRDVIYIRQPMFGADEELLRFGLRFTWSTWAAHPNRMTTLDFFRILNKLHVEQRIAWFKIGYGYPVYSTEENFIVPLNVDSEAITYNPHIHPDKPRLALNGIFKEVCVAIGLAGEADPAEAMRLLNCQRWVFESQQS